MQTTLDAIDIALLEVVRFDGRASSSKLGAKVGLSTSACHARLRRLEKEGIIIGYRAVIAPQVVRTVRVWAEVTLADASPASHAAFTASLRQFPDVTAAWRVSGGYDYLLGFIASDITTAQAAVDRIAQSDAPISALRTLVTLDEIKPPGADFLLEY